MGVGIEAAAVPLDQPFEQRAGAGRLSAVAQRDGFEDRVGSIGILAAGEQLLELELQAWARGDHLDQADLEQPVRLAPVLLGGIPDPALVQLQRTLRLAEVGGRVDQPARVHPSLCARHDVSLWARASSAPFASTGPVSVGAVELPLRALRLPGVRGLSRRRAAAASDRQDAADDVEARRYPRPSAQAGDPMSTNPVPCSECGTLYVGGLDESGRCRHCVRRAATQTAAVPTANRPCEWCGVAISGYSNKRTHSDRCRKALQRAGGKGPFSRPDVTPSDTPDG